jgi:hypothetical protein
VEHGLFFALSAYLLVNLMKKLIEKIVIKKFMQQSILLLSGAVHAEAGCIPLAVKL